MVTIFKGRIKNGVVVPDKPIDLPDGAVAEVRITIPETPNGGPPARSQAPSMLEVLDTMPPPGLFQTTEEVDRYIKEERDSWDS